MTHEELVEVDSNLNFPRFALLISTETECQLSTRASWIFRPRQPVKKPATCRAQTEISAETSAGRRARRARPVKLQSQQIQKSHKRTF